MKKVLIGSTIRQEPETLKYFLSSLRFLFKKDIQVDYMFIDDNIEQVSTNLLNKFRPLESNVNIIKMGGSQDKYNKDKVTHYWDEELTWKVAYFKNLIIDYCRKNNYGYLFLVDSDLVLHPATLINLIGTKKDIISEIFWTRWEPDKIKMPQVWLYDEYTVYRIDRRDKNLSKEERQKRSREFFNMLKKPGVYRVGGLGACTLFSRHILESGISFAEIYNISFWGEDRHLSIRAAALGFDLFVDTHYPAYHIYRKSDLEEVSNYIESFREMSFKGCKSQIFKIINGILLDMESLDFRYKFKGGDYKKYFTQQGWLSFNYDDKKEQTIKYRCIYRASRGELLDLSFYNQFRKCDLVFNLNFKGSEAGVKIEKSRKINIQFIYDYNWKINQYSIIKEESKCNNSQKMFIEGDNYVRIVKLGVPVLTLAMLVHDEADRYLGQGLEHISKYADNAVILDDASTDDTVKICRKKLKDIPIKIVSNEKSGFDNELKLRKQLWKMVLETDPDWILCLDADEIFEDRAITYIRKLIRNTEVDVYAFRLYDFWDSKYYREDQYWNAHLRYSPFLIRYQPQFSYSWNEKPLHCGRFPANITKLPTSKSSLRIKHFGWAGKKDREDKYEKYMRLDPEGEYGDIEQYESILDPDPNLKKWVE